MLMVWSSVRHFIDDDNCWISLGSVTVINTVGTNLMRPQIILSIRKKNHKQLWQVLFPKAGLIQWKR
jgi:hypothetical protein